MTTADAPAGQPDRHAERLAWMAGAILAAIQLFLLVGPYRTNADDVAFFEWAMSGGDVQLEMTLLNATSQGRIGGFYLVPANMIGAYFAEHLAFRIFCVLLFLAHFLLFAFYAQALLAVRCAAVVFMTLSALSIAGELLPPVYYPLQNTLPYLVILTARLAILRIRERSPGEAVDGPQLAWTIVATLAMLTSEFAFLFGTALLAAEHARALGRWRSAAGFAATTFGSQRFLTDLAGAAVAFGAYVAFRLAFPSGYVGNHIGPLSTLPTALYVATRHVFDMPIMAVLDPADWLPGSTPARWAVAAVAGLATAYASLRNWETVMRLRHPLLVALLALGLAYYVVLPGALTLRLQDWCLRLKYCIYLDSSAAFLGTTVALVALAAALAAFAARPGRRRWLTLPMSAGFGLLTACTVLYNWYMTDKLAAQAPVWERARAIACGDLPEGRPLAEAFDPDGVIVMHPDADAEQFWSIYRDHFSRHCPA